LPRLPGTLRRQRGAVLNLFLTAFVLAFLGAGMRRPFLLVLAYTYIDIVAPQKVTWGFLAHIPISLIAFVCAFGAWMVAENKQGIRFSFRQFLLLLLLVYCGLTTHRRFPGGSGGKVGWVWKALVFAMFLPLTAHAPAHRGAGIGDGAVHQRDRDRRRDQDAVLRRRLWRTEAAGTITPAFTKAARCRWWRLRSCR
jgi:hypothetical protein